jgi:hypothetical protein
MNWLQQVLGNRASPRRPPLAGLRLRSTGSQRRPRPQREPKRSRYTCNGARRGAQAACRQRWNDAVMGTGRPGELAGRAGATQPRSDQPSSSQFTPGPGQLSAGATDQPGGETVSRGQLAAWGVEPAYFDAAGRWCEAPEDTLRSIMRAMGAGEAPRPPEDAPLLVIGERGPWQHLPPGKLELEGGEAFDLGPVEERPPALPPGYHRLRRADGHEVVVAVCPPKCPEPPPGRSWGWSVQLYAARSRNSWGIGDFAD